MPEGTGQTYLYGELHFSEAIHARELELWSECYHQRGMRHLFLELSYFDAQWLNRWMQEDSDELLDEYIQDIVELRQAANSPLPPEAYELEREFYKRIKEDCPDTVFHGTDVGHGQWSFGERYLKYLEDAGQVDTEPYRLTKENMEQGRYFYESAPGGNHTYREEKMVENFIGSGTSWAMPTSWASTAQATWSRGPNHMGKGVRAQYGQPAAGAVRGGCAL